jgi:DivIVA domain-containing protein
VPLTPKDVQDVRFDHAPLGKRGYHEDQVDDFLDRVELALEGGGDLTAQDVRQVEFDQGSIVRRGYDEKQVDDFLEVVVNYLENPSTNGHQVVTPEVTDADTQPVPVPRKALPAPVVQPEPDPNSVPLPPAVPGMHGYRQRDVQRMAECVRASLRSPHGPTADDIARMRLDRVEEGDRGLDPFLVEALRDAWVAELRRQGR